jgi:oligoendopeptidase F
MTQPAAVRETGAEKVFWDLSSLYTSREDPQINQDMETIQQMADTFAQTYRGKLATMDGEEWRQAFDDLATITEYRAKLSTYANLNFTVYSNDPAWGAFIQKMQEAGAKLGQTLVFFELEWNELPDEKAQAVLNDPVLQEYRYYLEAERRYKPYQLSEVEEQLLIEKNVTGAGSWVRFFSQLMASMRYDFDGQKLTQSDVLSKLQQPDRDIRAKAADSVTAAIREKQMELTFIFNTLAADKAADDKRRKFPSWISSRNLSNKAPDAVVEALVSAVTSNYDLVARHYKTKKALLGYQELFDYDRYAPLTFGAEDSFYSWEEARKMVTDAYTAFSPRMGEIANQFFDQQWIHAPAMSGKRGGAYASYGTKSGHPWVFMNFTGRSRDVMTLAHELGHGLHMYLAGRAQPIFYMYTPLTTAETASVFGEMIVFHDLMKKESNPTTRLTLLAGKIEDTFSTVYRQISMNRFEDKMHTARRTEGELSTPRLNDIWLETQNAMFQGSVTLREDYGQWWSYIPHFLHTPGYVYAYAFGELLVLALFNLYQQRGASFVPEYEGLLSAGDSDYPENLLARLGVNLNDPQFWSQGIEAIRVLVNEEEALAKQLFPEKFA